jgi:di/tricarboxylate transporter
MTPQIALTLAILAGTVALLVSDRLSSGIVALLALLALVFIGLLTPAEALSSLASPVVVSIGSIFVLSAALFQTGVASMLGRAMFRLAGDREWLLIVILMAGAALLSAFMNNVATTAVLMPAVIGIAVSTNRSEACLLLPLALASTLGGTLTLIGSPPNLIASQAMVEAGFEPFGFLEITPVGILNLVAATTYTIAIGRRLLPSRPARNRWKQMRLPSQLIKLYQLPERVYFCDVLPSSPLVGSTLDDSHLGRDYGITVLGIMNGSIHKLAPPATAKIRAHDRLLVQGGPRRLDRAATEKGLSFTRAEVSDTDLLAGDVGVAEVTLSPRSSLVGQTLRELNFREHYGLTVVALWRGGDAIERDISDEPLRQGDAFLVQGTWRKILLLREQPGLLLLSEHEGVPRRTRRAPWAIAILLAMVVTVIAKILPLEIASLAAAVLTVVTGCLRVEEAWDAVEWRVVFLIAGMLALGLAMQKTGAAQWIALTILGPVASLGPLALTAAQLLITGLLTLAISNHATAALVAPIAMNVALSHGIDPRPLLMAVAVGTTTALFTPFAHPSLILVMGPGGYRFKDYVRVGGPLSAIMFLTSLLGIVLLYGI